MKQVEIDRFEVIENQLDHSQSSSEMPEIVNADEASEIIIEDNIAKDEEITKEEIKEAQTIEESSEKYANSPQNIGNENIDIPENKEIDFDQDTFVLDSHKNFDVGEDNKMEEPIIIEINTLEQYNVHHSTDNQAQDKTDQIEINDDEDLVKAEEISNENNNIS